MSYKLYNTLIFSILSFLLIAQTPDPVLFKVAGNPVNLSEFEYIYNKNNGKDADYSKKSIEEYLDLYTKFKLKVQAAKDMRLDTVPELIKELNGYKQQLTSSYLNDKEVSDRLSKELYERMKKDVKISHILFNVSISASPEDSLAAYKKAKSAYDMLKIGTAFNEVVKRVSEDHGSKDNGGNIGWFNAMFPEGFYTMENYAYNLKPSEYSMPFRTKLGYHILRKDDERPARGKIEAAHLLIKKSMKGKPDELAKIKIDSLYKLVKAGKSFEEIVRDNSGDRLTSNYGGNVGFFGINQFEAPFEDAAFGLKADGDISAPIETSIGWHIVKRLRVEQMMPFEKVRKKLQADIAKDSRFAAAQLSLIERIKTESGFKQNNAALERFITSLDSSFFTYKWKAPETYYNDTIFTLGKEHYTTTHFIEFIKTNTRQRLQFADSKTPKEIIQIMSSDFVSQKCLQLEENRLEEKYPDFKSLMREYREGILLFEATKINVWDKASNDSTGLSNFYMRNKDTYRWDARGTVYAITIDTIQEKLVDKIYKYISKNSVSKAISKYNSSHPGLISFVKTSVEKKNTKDYEGLSFAAGNMTGLTKDLGKDQVYFKKMEDMLPAMHKTIDEARGYIIADYQDYLDKLWVDDLRKKYVIDLNKDVLTSIIKQ